MMNAYQGIASNSRKGMERSLCSGFYSVGLQPAKAADPGEIKPGLFHQVAYHLGAEDSQLDVLAKSIQALRAAAQVAFAQIENRGASLFRQRGEHADACKKSACIGRVGRAVVAETRDQLSPARSSETVALPRLAA